MKPKYKRAPKGEREQNPIAVIMHERYRNTGTIMRDRRNRRPKDARRDETRQAQRDWE